MAVVVSEPRPISPLERASVERLLAALCEEYGISPQPALEWSGRLRRVLGKAYHDRRLIRLSAWLDHEQAQATLRHELAHVAVGRGRRPHGERWKAWAEAGRGPARDGAHRPVPRARSVPAPHGERLGVPRLRTAHRPLPRAARPLLQSVRPEAWNARARPVESRGRAILLRTAPTGADSGCDVAEGALRPRPRRNQAGLRQVQGTRRRVEQRPPQAKGTTAPASRPLPLGVTSSIPWRRAHASTGRLPSNRHHSTSAFLPNWRRRLIHLGTADDRASSATP